MTKPNVFKIFAALTAAMVVAAVVGVALQRSPGVSTADRDPAFPSLAGKVNEVTRIAITSNKHKFTIQRDAKGWGMAEKGGYPVKFESVKTLILALAELKLLESKTSDPTRYDRLDVQKPEAKESKSRRVVLSDKDGDVLASAIIGKRNPDLFGAGGGGTYLRLKDEARSWLAEGDVQVGGEPNDWLDRMIVDVSEENVRRVEIRQPDGARVVISKAKKGGKNFKLADVPKGREVDQSEVNALAGGMWRLSLEDVKPAAKFRFAEKFHRAVFETFDGLRVTAEITMIKDTAWARFRAEAVTPAGKTSPDKKVAKKATEITARARGWVYELSPGEGERLTTKLKGLLKKAKGA